MKITKLVQSYSEPEGLSNIGDKIEVTEDRAKQLIAAGFAVEGWADAPVVTVEPVAAKTKAEKAGE